MKRERPEEMNEGIETSIMREIEKIIRCYQEKNLTISISDRFEGAI